MSENTTVIPAAPGCLLLVCIMWKRGSSEKEITDLAIDEFPIIGWRVSPDEEHPAVVVAGYSLEWFVEYYEQPDCAVQWPDGLVSAYCATDLDGRLCSREQRREWEETVLRRMLSHRVDDTLKV